MQIYAWSRVVLLALATLVVITALPLAETSLAQSIPPATDAELAQMFAPALYFHPAEIFRPQSVDVMVNTARLRQARRNWFDINVLPNIAISDLFDYHDDSYALDAWYGDEGASGHSNYTAHRAYYQAVLSPEAAGTPIVAYAHIVRDRASQHVTIQYWLFYYYNDWFNKHEGDWEMVQVMLDAEHNPQWLVLSQHHGGTRRPWSAIQVQEGTHPAVYVALGSHANYFWGDEIYPNVTTIGNARLEIMDRTGTSGRIVPDIIMIPEREQIAAQPAMWSGLEWLLFGGHWGERALQSDFSGPLGPAEKGDQWERPYAWGMAQPPDADTWYANRLRVAVAGEGAKRAQVTLHAATGGALPSAETLGNVALLHSDPAPQAVIRADIVVPSGLSYDLIATWPDAEASQVTRYRFENLASKAQSCAAGDSGRASLVLRAGEPPVLTKARVSGGVQRATAAVEEVTWDAPDLVWLVGILPASDVVRGVLVSLLAGLLPTVLYVGALYWTDRYEKEPTRMLAAAFLWGAIPALLVAIAVRLFFRLPIDLLGPQAIEAVRAGLVAPLIEEALKGAAVIFIAVRYRREFDNVLDGIIYGAMVGFGFAMTGNTLSYLGAFLLRGFGGLSSTIFVEGVLYGLNHALYSAILGAGLGYARLAQQRWRRWFIPPLAFSLAVLGHALHNLAIRNAIGLNPLTVAATWAGIVVIVVVMVWSLKRQQRCLATELAGEIPDAIYRTLIVRGERSRAQWRALWRQGPQGWRRVRRAHQQCAELAFKKMQHRQRPNEPGLLEEIGRLRKQTGALIDRTK